MKSKEKLFRLQERFEPHLRDEDFTFIAPINNTGFFINSVYNISPLESVLRTTTDCIRDSELVLFALNELRPETDLDLFVGFEQDNLMAFGYMPLNEYCKDKNIEFEI